MTTRRARARAISDDDGDDETTRVDETHRRASTRAIAR
jgi:hypothetical protein